ncbi:cation:dicarboxylate symporter family transporter [Kineococcus rhizosphaerae]|uniref:Aerobic C4-dicarboxylate transport protein n=1 Tax=Kineococcus rhizosphaerae TaxID=559628 RepID=A0A2T0R5R5_9ACTN|nr:cation:dicarboxylase symporter family transporter [Kineococcus rhizosphaerae]PRY16057.1 aerobic C4-dicarboxylate transport protein [Kineococcus rhizosphaerae]
MSTVAQKHTRDRTHFLYIAVIVAVGLGIAVGLLFPDVGKELKPLGTGFVNLVRMMIAPVIFCTIVLGIGSVRAAAQVGRVGGTALLYFLAMSGFALVIGLLVGNVLPVTDLQLTDDLRGQGAQLAEKAHESGGSVDFLLGIIPTSLFSALTDGSVLEALFVALLVGFALQGLGETGQRALRAIETVKKVVFKVLAMVMWAAPVGAFGAIAAVVGETGVDALKALATVMVGFYLTCAVFVLVVLGLVLRVVAKLNIFKVLRYTAREILLIVSTSSSETALPRLIAKMEHAGVSKSTVGITVPTGYSFNLDGTAIYLTMASLFIANSLGQPMSVGQQVSLLLFMVIASKGAAGVSGAGLATLAGGLASHKPALLDGVGLIVGIDRFMSEARAVTNFIGNTVGTLVIATWSRTLDREQLTEVLAGRRPFDETSMDPANEAVTDVRAESRVPA